MNKKEWRYITTWSKKIKAINLLGGKCYQCDEDRPWVLDFHHNDSNQKEFEISRIKDYRWSIIEKEIQKCILLCRNCHRNFQFNKESTYKKYKTFLLNIIDTFHCEVCNYNNCMAALDFHHNKNKDFGLGGIRLYENSCEEVKQNIIEEMDKCTILCGNCHNDLHFDKERFNKYKEQIYNYNVKEKQKPLDKQKVIDMFNSGIKQIDIAKELNCAKSTVCQIIKNI
jgi:transposase-like protein